MTTHVDQQNERFARSALESAADQLRRSYIPIGLEHDPRLPPFGRVVSAKLLDLSDGEVGLFGLMELFEPNEVIPLANDDRTIPAREEPIGVVELIADRGLLEAFGHELSEIETLLDRRISTEIKKGVGGPEVLTLAATFVLGAIAGGFLQQLGADIYAGIKHQVLRIFRKEYQADRLLRILVTVENGPHRVTIDVIVTNPSPDQISLLFDAVPRQLDAEVPQILDANPDIRRLVFELSGPKLIHKFAVRRDAVPLFPRSGQGDHKRRR